MILQARKWRLLLRMLTLGVTSVLMLAFAEPVSYALHDDTPRSITDSRYLLDQKGQPLSNVYVNLRGVPDLSRSFTTRSLLSARHWIPLQGYDNIILLSTDNSMYLFPYDYNPEQGFIGQTQVEYNGKITPLKEEANSQEIVNQLARQGLIINKDTTMVLSLGEKPSSYRPIVPVMPVLAWLWGAALLGLLQIWRGRPRTGIRKPRYA